MKHSYFIVFWLIYLLLFIIFEKQNDREVENVSFSPSARDWVSGWSPSCSVSSKAARSCAGKQQFMIQIICLLPHSPVQAQATREADQGIESLLFSLILLSIRLLVRQLKQIFENVSNPVGDLGCKHLNFKQWLKLLWLNVALTLFETKFVYVLASTNMNMYVYECTYTTLLPCHEKWN